MKTTILLATLFAMLGGCTLLLPGHLYPVQGPLSKEATPPIYTATLNGTVFLFGSITVHLAAGVTCHGDWKAVSGGDPTARQMSVEWDEVYGSGYFLANVLGKYTLGRSALTCSNAETLNLEFLLGEAGKTSSTIGVAKDDAGNIFKLAF